MAQVVPSLMMTMALRHAFDIPGIEGRIQNVGESMCYMFNSILSENFQNDHLEGGGICTGGICS